MNSLKWKDRTLLQKIITIINILICIAIITFAILELFNILNNNIYTLLLGLMCILENFALDKKDKFRIVSIIVGIALVICYIIAL